VRNWVNCETQSAKRPSTWTNSRLKNERSNHRLSRVVLVFRSPQLALQTTVYYTIHVWFIHINAVGIFGEFRKISQILEATTAKQMKIDPHCQRQHWNLLNIVRENVRNPAKKRKKSRLFGFWILKKRKKNVEVITYMPIVLETTVTTLNQFCCLSHNSKAIIF